ncbi:MAG: LamG domain-containing protein [Chloroflexota bacterium]
MDTTRGLVLSMADQMGGPSPSIVSIKDQSRRKNDSIAMTGITWSQLPSGLWVANFDGATSYINFGSPLSVTGLSKCTITSWVKATVLGVDNRTIIRKQMAAGREFTMAVSFTSKPFYTAYARIVVVDPYTILVNRWYFIAASWSGGLNFSLYINDLRFDLVFGALPVVVRTATPMVVGQHSLLNNTEVWNGSMAEINFYNCALSPMQVRTLYGEQRRFFGV